MPLSSFADRGHSAPFIHGSQENKYTMCLDCNSPKSGMMLMRVASVEQIAGDIYQFVIRGPDDSELPKFGAGAHIEVCVPNGSFRKFSLCNDPMQRDRYVIAVKRVSDGRGGSVSLIDGVKSGDTIWVSPPINNFSLPPRAQEFVFIAGGIGITPIMAMIREIAASKGKNFKLYYCTRSPETTAFMEELCGSAFRECVVIHHDQGDPSQALEFQSILRERKNRAHLYCCGPKPLMEAVRRHTKHWSPTAVHFEAFNDTDIHRPDDKAFVVKIKRSGEMIEVPAGVTILDAMRARGLDVPSSCETGTCGTCRYLLIEGEADHRDLVLSDEQRQRAIMICVSRAKSHHLLIDR
jgi:phthalate 4,5-dioxygenase reductase subunit